MTEQYKPLYPEIVDGGGIIGVNPYFLARTWSFLINYGFPKEWEEDLGHSWYFAANIWGDQGLYLGTNVAEPDDLSSTLEGSFLIAKAPSKRRIEIAVIKWGFLGIPNNTHRQVWWDKGLTVDEAGYALSLMEDRMDDQEEIFGEQFEELQY